MVLSRKTLIITGVVVIMTILMILYLGGKGVTINNELNDRSTTAMTVFDDPAYKTSKEDFPNTYYNEFLMKQLPLNICDFYWAGSRKSYQPAGQSYDITSYDTIKTVLLKGARVIDLDIYSSDADNKFSTDAKPVVRNATLMPIKGHPLDFSKCLDIIREYAWSDNTNYPLILHLGLHVDDNKFLYASIAEAIDSAFRGVLINKKYGFNGRNDQYPFGQIQITEIAGRIAIITDTYPTAGVLDEFITAVTSDKMELVRTIQYDMNYKSYGGIAGQHIDTRELITFNMKQVTIVNSPGQLSFENVYEPKSDLYNPPIDDCQKYGCQIVLMNYQLLDDNMKDFLKIFRKSSLVLKTEDLRFIPRPPKPVKIQNKKLYFNSRTVESPGWFKLNY